MTGAVAWWMQAAAATLWIAAIAILAPRSNRPSAARIGGWLVLAGCLVGSALLALLWIELARPPLRTLGETRLWYAVLSVGAGTIIGWRLRTGMLRIPMLLLGLAFLVLNLALPQSLDRTLMPALRSPLFVPHVVVYLLAYAVLGLSAAVAVWRLARRQDDASLPLDLALSGLPLLTIGLCLGAVWAKEAWGHYWAWDPKETWALLTWIAYVCVIHAEPSLRERPRRLLALIAGCFAVVLMCWFLVNLLPSTAVSVHTYTRQ